jgi:hypothetical protein
MIISELFQFSQISLFVFLIALLGVIRERTVLPYVLVALGSFLHGSIAATLIAALVVWIRFDGGAPQWLRFKDAVAMFLIASASALPQPYREFMICVGVVLLSIHIASGKLGIIPALLLVHLYLGDAIQLEFVLGASGAYILIAEALKLSKTPYEKQVLQSLEVPALAGILFPFNEAVLRWSDDQGLLGLAIGVVVLIVMILIWCKLKKPDFKTIYLLVHERSNVMFRPMGRLVSNETPWLKAALPEVETQIDRYFNRLFLGLALVIGTWLFLVLIQRGGLL